MIDEFVICGRKVRSGVAGKWFDRVVFPQEILDNSTVIPAG